MAEKKHKKFKSRLQVIIPASFVFLLVAMVAVVVYTTRTIIHPILIKQHEQQIEDAGNMVVAEINGMLNQAETVAMAMASVTEGLSANETTILKAIPPLLSRPGFESFIAGGGIWPEPYQLNPLYERRSFFWGRDENGRLKFYDDYNRPEGPGYHHEEWYVPVRYVSPGRAVWSRAYVDPYSRQPMVTCSVPIFRHEKFAGVATVDLKLEGLARLFSKASRNINGYIFVLDRNNRFLSFPDEGLVTSKKGGSGKGQGIQKYVTSAELASMLPDFSSVSYHLEEINRKIIQMARKKPGYREDLVALLEKDSYQIDRKEAQLIAAIMADPFDKSTSASNRLYPFIPKRMSFPECLP